MKSLSAGKLNPFSREIKKPTQGGLGKLKYEL
jgi:hypothetical protein